MDTQTEQREHLHDILKDFNTAMLVTQSARRRPWTTNFTLRSSFERALAGVIGAAG